MSKNTDTFDALCGDCAGIDLRNVSAEDVIAQAKIYGASEEQVQSAVLGLAEYKGVSEKATCPQCGMEFPASDDFADVFGPSDPKCPRCQPYIEGTAAGPTEEELARMECEQSIVRKEARK